MGSIKHAVFTFAKAQCTAWIASAVDFGVTIFLVSVCGVWYPYATFIGAVLGGIVNCACNYRWVFHAFGMRKSKVAFRYAIVWTGSILLNFYGTYTLTESTGISYLISKTIVAAIVAVCWNYQLQSRYVFRSKKKEEQKKNRQ